MLIYQIVGNTDLSSVKHCRKHDERNECWWKQGVTLITDDGDDCRPRWYGRVR